MTLRKSQMDAVFASQDEEESIKLWASEAPLKLVGWALDSMGRTAKSADIRGKLDGRMVQDPSWRVWWSRVLPAVKKSRYFNVRSNNTITLLANPSTIPDEPWTSLSSPAKTAKKKAPSATDWRKWFLSGALEPSPSRAPTKTAFSALSKLTAKDIGAAQRQISHGAEEFLASGSSSKRDATAWMECMIRALARVRYLTGTEAAMPLAQASGLLLARLIKATGYDSEPAKWLLAEAGLGWETAAWRQQFMAGWWLAFEDFAGGTRELLDATAAHVGRDGQAALALELMVAALRTADTTQQHSELDRVLDRLFPSERVQLIQDLIVRAADGETFRQDVLSYLANSRHAGGLQDSALRLRLLVMASLLLTDGTGPLTDQTSWAISGMLADPEPSQSAPVWAGLLSQSRQHISDLQEQHTQELENQQFTMNTVWKRCGWSRNGWSGG